MPQKPSTPAFVLRSFLLVAGYVALGLLGLRVAFIAGNVTILWPAAGLALVCVAAGGARYLPAVALGAALTTASTGAPFLAVLLVGAGNACECAVGVEIARRLGLNLALSRLGDVGAIFVAAALSSVVGAISGTASLVMSGVVPLDKVFSVFGVWWVGDATGIAVAAPLFATVVARNKWEGISRFELMALLAGVALMAAAVFRLTHAAAWAVFPVLMLVALRAGPLGAAAAVNVVAFVAALYTLQGSRAFGEFQLHTRLAMLQAFVTTASLTALLLAAAVATVRRAEAERIRLEAAEAAAAERAELREQLLSIVGHDLRTPLSAVLTGAMLIEEQAREQVVIKTAARVKRSAQRMSGLISDVMDFTRIRLGASLPCELGPCHVGNLCERVIDEVKLGRPRAVVELHVEGTLETRADPGRLAQAITNLVANGLEHGNGGVRVIARGDSEMISVLVANGGKPIPDDQLATLFEPYTKGSRTHGVGLGLYIVREIASAHGGEVRVTSNTLETVFELRVPRPHDGTTADSFGFARAGQPRSVNTSLQHDESVT